MSIYRRGKTWWIQITAANGDRIQRSAKTCDKKEAEELHDRLKADTWRTSKLKEKPRRTWKEAVIRWLTENQNKKSLETDKVILRWYDQRLKNAYLDEITRDTIESFKLEKLNEGASHGTINRYISVITAILNKANKQWDWISDAPKIIQLPEKTKRLRWLSNDEAKRLLDELPEHLNAMTRFTLATGLREANVCGLTWSQVDLKRKTAWIHADEAKGAKAIPVPLGAEAANVLQEQIGKNDTYVFTYNGQPVTRCNNHAWKKALMRADIHDFRWHDLRHTWASWHVQNGTPLNILKELGGWADLKMVLRYAHLSSDHLKEFAGNTKPK